MSKPSQPTKKKAMSARRQARAAAVQALYQWELKQHTVDDVYAHCLEHYSEARWDRDYFKVLLYSTIEQLSVIDDIMKPVLDRDSQSLTPVELAVLRVALYELKFRIDVPGPVVINEALELAKSFGTEEGYRYINGVLDNLLAELRPTPAGKR